MRLLLRVNNECRLQHAAAISKLDTRCRTIAARHVRELRTRPSVDFNPPSIRLNGIAEGVDNGAVSQSSCICGRSLSRVVRPDVAQLDTSTIDESIRQGS